MSAPIKDPKVAFKQGRIDARRGWSRSSVRYANPKMAEAWERGWETGYREAIEANETIRKVRPKKATA